MKIKGIQYNFHTGEVTFQRTIRGRPCFRTYRPTEPSLNRLLRCVNREESPCELSTDGWHLDVARLQRDGLWGKVEQLLYAAADVDGCYEHLFTEYGPHGEILDYYDVNTDRLYEVSDAASEVLEGLQGIEGERG